MTDLVLLIQTKLHLIFSGMAWIVISQQLHYCDDDDDDDDDDDNDNEDADDKNDTDNDGHHLRTTHSWGVPHQNMRHEQHSFLKQVTPFPGLWSCVVCGTKTTLKNVF